MNKAIVELIGMIIGVLLLIGGIKVYFYQINSTTSSVEKVKSDYANDNVYSEAALAVTDESEISRDELIALVINNPKTNIVIRDDVSGYSIRIISGENLNSTMLVSQGVDLSNPLGDWTSEGDSGQFYQDEWSAEKMDINTWFQAHHYTVSPVVKYDGNVNYVFYYGKE